MVVFLFVDIAHSGGGVRFLTQKSVCVMGKLLDFTYVYIKYNVYLCKICVHVIEFPIPRQFW